MDRIYRINRIKTNPTFRIGSEFLI